MAIITVTREAKCKDCQHISLLYCGKRKRFICDKKHALLKGKNSKICQEDYQYREEYHIKTKKQL